jgi:hypothetical protein
MKKITKDGSSYEDRKKKKKLIFYLKNIITIVAVLQ